mgnify:CR=1 FL=1
MTNLRRFNSCGILQTEFFNRCFADFEFLFENGLCVDKIISRPAGNMEADGKLKAKQLGSLFNLRQFKLANKVMFDDAPSVRSSLRKLGIAVICPTKIQERVS